VSIYAWADVIGVSVCIVVIVCGAAALLIDRHRDPIGLHAGTDDVEEHLKPLRSGSAKVGRRISAEFRSKGLMLPNRASSAGRKLATALDKSRPAGRLHRLAPAARAIARALAMGPALLIPEEERRAARQAARKGRHRAAPDARTPAELIAAAAGSVLLAAPLAALPEVAHGDPGCDRDQGHECPGPGCTYPLTSECVKPGYEITAEVTPEVDPAAGMWTGNTEAIADTRNGGHAAYADPDTARYGWDYNDGPCPDEPLCADVESGRISQPLAEPEDPYDLLTDPVDAYIGDLGPAETEPERVPRRQPGRFPPVAAFRVRALVAGALAVAAREALGKAYPEWPTGQFKAIDAAIGAAQ
jgi:hypothetical protein